MRSDSEKTKLFFNRPTARLPPRRARRPGPARSPTNFGSEALAPKETSLPHARTQLRTHARTHTRTATETEIDFPIGTTPPNLQSSKTTGALLVLGGTIRSSSFSSSAPPITPDPYDALAARFTLEGTLGLRARGVRGAVVRGAPLPLLPPAPLTPGPPPVITAAASGGART